MNISILVSSFKYLICTPVATVSLASWIYEELRSQKYTDAKFLLSLLKQDVEIFKELIYISTDRQKVAKIILHNVGNHKSKRYLTLQLESKLSILKKADINIQFEDNLLLRHAFKHGLYFTAERLLKVGADVHFDNDYMLSQSVIHDKLLMIETCLKYGATVTDDMLKIASKKQNSKVIDLLNKLN